MLWLFLAMLITGLMWLAWGVIFIGLGSLVSRLYGYKPTTWEDLLISFWVGLVAVMGLLQMWHLVLPIDERAGLCVAVIGVIGFARLIPDMGVLLRRRLTLSPVMGLLGLGLIIFLIWLANRAINLPLDPDSPYYHLSLIEWQRHYAVIPGLANVMEPFIYNNASFLYATLLDSGIWQYHGYHFVTSLPMAALACLIVLYTRQWLRQPTFSYEYALAPLLIGLLIMLTISGSISSPSSDYLVFFLAIVVFFQYILHLRESAETPAAQYRVFVIILLCTASFLVKFSLAPFFGFIALLSLGRWLWHVRQSKAVFSSRLMVALVISVCALGLPWVIRSFIISGYAAYPFTAVSLPVEWRVPNEIVAKITNSIRIVGFDYEIPESVLAVWTWVPRWLQNSGRDLYFVWLPSLWMIGLSGVWLLLRLTGRWSRSERALWWLTPIVPALLVWFFNAPQVKYASALIWLLTTALTIVILRGWQMSLPRKKLVVLGIAFLFALYPLFLAVRARIVLTQPGEYYGFYGVVHFDLPYHAFLTNSGLTVWTGPQCYYNALPCSLFLNENLALRDPSDMSQGFRIDPDP